MSSLVSRIASSARVGCREGKMAGCDSGLLVGLPKVIVGEEMGTVWLVDGLARSG
jgi:hypothetical protein